ncbi:hypothetical protein E2C01_083136 [Portunus trituberculatus]|uniref:Uncharacterized protein n=1 Tax=Portunus trituberculatus TaxID=210409 RepID=A0A5B7J2M9_PORTR|nr:hypothetical protein [Portunus trituberculatus]
MGPALGSHVTLLTLLSRKTTG